MTNRTPHVAGSIVGTGAFSIANIGGTTTSHVHGMALGVRLVFHSVRCLIASNKLAVHFDRYVGGFNAGYANSARVQSNSWSANCNNQYMADARLIDRYAYLHPSRDWVIIAGTPAAGGTAMGRFARRADRALACTKQL